MQSSLEQFIKAAAVFPEAIVIADVTGQIVLANAKTETMFGYQPDELIGQPIETLMPERYRERHVHHRNDFNQAPRSRLMGLALDLVGRRKNGDEFPIEVSLSPAETDTGMLTIGMVHDITARKRAEEERRQSEERYRSLFENAVFGIFRSTPAGYFIDANPALCSMLGYDSVQELLQKGSTFDVFHNSSQRCALLEELDRHDRISGFDAVWKRKDGKPMTVRLSGRTVRTTRGDISAFEMLAEDVTHRLTLEEQFRHSQKMEAIGRLADSIVHDFNNLMAVISAQSELVLDLEDLPSIRRETQVIMATAERAAALTKQLLAFSRKQEIEPKIFSCNELLRNVDQMLGRLLTEDIQLKTVLDPDLGNVLADPGQIEQVVMNLVVNARDAMPNGGTLTIETSNVELDTFYARDHLDVNPGPYVILAVSDTGVGISAEVRSRIFEPFFTTKPAGHGTGLGLSTVYAIVKKDHGHVWYYTELNQGTTFKVYLPRVDRPVELIQPDKTPVRATAHAGTILLVEDEDSLQQSIRQLLTRAGYIVLAASRGVEALRILEDHGGQIDLVLTDIGLPHMRGPEMVERIRTRRPNIAVLYMSGFGEDGLRPDEAAQLSGRFIQKPFRRDILLRKLEETLAPVP
jgi:two-component system, cell cycle sensor histidine kinase and response regulator CckA